MWGLFLSLLGYLGISPTPLIAYLIGATDPAIKLFLSILMGYPLAIVYHKYVRQHPSYKNLYFIVTGLDMAWYNFGSSMYHNAIPTIVLYITTFLLGRGKNNVIVTFIFNMAYLLTGYVMTESEDYDITWTMPHCVLTLKLISLSFDMWDGEERSKGAKLSENASKSALDRAPTIAELFAFVYFPSGFLIGPLFSFKRYLDYANDKFPLENSEEYKQRSLERLFQGTLYVAAHQIGISVFNMKYMLSDEFSENSILYRHIYCGLWAHFALYKYISCWLLTEAACIRFGLSYNGTKDGKHDWDGCSNIKLLRFESATKFLHYIESFNCNTNYFAAEYIYKRLKFLGNRNLSQLFTLLFLAVWHGTRSGYYVTFFNEFIIVFMEKELEPILVKTELYHQVWSNTLCKYFLLGLLKFYTIVYMGWSLVPFDLKVYPKWLSVYSSLYFSGFLLFMLWPLYKLALLKLIKLLKLKQH